MPLQILALDDEPEMVTLYRETFCIKSDFPDDQDVFDLVICRGKNDILATVKDAKENKRPFEVIILNLDFKSNPETIQITKEINKIDAKLNFILISKTIDKVREVLSNYPTGGEKFLFIQQPVHPYELRQFVMVLLEKYNNELLLNKTRQELELKINELEKKSAELFTSMVELENLNNQLLETNNALTVLARNLENTRKESERRMFQKTRTLILPVIDKIMQARGMQRYQADLDLLAGYVLNLTSDFSSDVRMSASLSSTEARIASMIKNGLSSDEIARHLNISHYTVKTHRKNIRKKLNLLNSGVNLRAFLESQMDSK